MFGTITKLAAFAMVLGLAACAGRPPAPTPPDPAHNARNALDWAGSYRGILPCADCEGIETTINLYADGQYCAQLVYLGKPGTPWLEHGAFTWGPEGNSVTLQGSEPSHYFVSENRLVRLAADGSRIQGPLAPKYELPRIAPTAWPGCPKPQDTPRS